MAQCVVCSRGGKRICELCSNASYCSAEHQYTHWLQQHKNECTYENAGDDFASLISTPRGQLRRAAAAALASDDEPDQAAIHRALCCAFASLRTGVRRKDVMGEKELQDAVLLAHVLKASGDVDGAAYWLRSCAGIVAREPYPEWARNKAVFEYAAQQCSEIGQLQAMVDICELQAASASTSSGGGGNQLDAAEAYLKACQTRVQQGDLHGALRQWERAVAIQERYSSRSDVRERLMDSYKFGYMIYSINGNLSAAAEVGSKGRNLARAGNTDKGLSAAEFALKMGDALMLMNRLPESLASYEEAYKTRKLAHGDGGDDTIAARKKMNKVRKVLGYDLVPGPGQAVRGGGAAGGSSSGKVMIDGDGGAAAQSTPIKPSQEGRDGPSMLEAPSAASSSSYGGGGSARSLADTGLGSPAAVQPTRESAGASLAAMAGMLTKTGKEEASRAAQQSQASSSGNRGTSSGAAQAAGGGLTDLDISKPRSGPFAQAAAMFNQQPERPTGRTFSASYQDQPDGGGGSSGSSGRGGGSARFSAPSSAGYLDVDAVPGAAGTSAAGGSGLAGRKRPAADGGMASSGGPPASQARRAGESAAASSGGGSGGGGSRRARPSGGAAYGGGGGGGGGGYSRGGGYADDDGADDQQESYGDVDGGAADDADDGGADEDAYDDYDDADDGYGDDVGVGGEEEDDEGEGGLGMAGVGGGGRYGGSGGGGYSNVTTRRAGGNDTGSSGPMASTLSRGGAAAGNPSALARQVEQLQAQLLAVQSHIGFATGPPQGSPATSGYSRPGTGYGGNAAAPAGGAAAGYSGYVDGYSGGATEYQAGPADDYGPGGYGDGPMDGGGGAGPMSPATIASPGGGGYGYGSPGGGGGGGGGGQNMMMFSPGLAASMQSAAAQMSFASPQGRRGGGSDFFGGPGDGGQQYLQQQQNWPSDDAYGAGPGVGPSFDDAAFGGPGGGDAGPGPQFGNDQYYDQQQFSGQQFSDGPMSSDQAAFGPGGGGPGGFDEGAGFGGMNAASPNRYQQQQRRKLASPGRFGGGGGPSDAYTGGPGFNDGGAADGSFNSGYGGPGGDAYGDGPMGDGGMSPQQQQQYVNVGGYQGPNGMYPGMEPGYPGYTDDGAGSGGPSGMNMGGGGPGNDDGGGGGYYPDQGYDGYGAGPATPPPGSPGMRMRRGGGPGNFTLVSPGSPSGGSGPMMTGGMTSPAAPDDTDMFSGPGFGPLGGASSSSAPGGPISSWFNPSFAVGGGEVTYEEMEHAQHNQMHHMMAARQRQRLSMGPGGRAAGGRRRRQVMTSPGDASSGGPGLDSLGAGDGSGPGNFDATAGQGYMSDGPAGVGGTGYGPGYPGGAGDSFAAYGDADEDYDDDDDGMDEPAPLGIILPQGAQVAGLDSAQAGRQYVLVDSSDMPKGTAAGADGKHIVLAPGTRYRVYEDGEEDAVPARPRMVRAPKAADPVLEPKVSYGGVKLKRTTTAFAGKAAATGKANPSSTAQSQAATGSVGVDDAQTSAGGQDAATANDDVGGATGDDDGGVYYEHDGFALAGRSQRQQQLQAAVSEEYVADDGQQQEYAYTGDGDVVDGQSYGDASRRAVDATTAAGLAAGGAASSASIMRRRARRPPPLPRGVRPGIRRQGQVVGDGGGGGGAEATVASASSAGGLAGTQPRRHRLIASEAEGGEDDDGDEDEDGYDGAEVYATAGDDTVDDAGDYQGGYTGDGTASTTGNAGAQGQPGQDATGTSSMRAAAPGSARSRRILPRIPRGQNYNDVAAAAAAVEYEDLQRRLAMAGGSGDATGAAAIGGASLSTPMSFFLPRSYDLGLAAMGSSAVAGSPSKADAPSGTVADSPAEVERYLGAMAQQLTNAMTGLVMAAEKQRTARWQGDGQLAVDVAGAQALDGKESQAVALQTALTNAVKALSATSDAEVSSQPSVLKMRDVLFTIIAEVGREVNTVLTGSSIDMNVLNTIAAQPSSSTAPGALSNAARPGPGSPTNATPGGPGRPGPGPAGRPGPVGPGGAARPGAGGAASAASEAISSSTQQLEARLEEAKRRFEREQAEARAAASNAANAGAAAASSAAVTSTAIVAAGAASAASSAGASMMAAMLRQAETLDGLRQRGLIRAEDNPSGRRMKAVYMAADEILTSLQGRLLALGLFKSMGNQSRQRRSALKLLFMGTCAMELRAKVARRRRGKLMGIGVMAMLHRMRMERLRAAKLQTLGFLKRAVISRNESRRAVKMAALGMLLHAKKVRDADRRVSLLFAAGLFATLHRTQGNPAGFKYGVKAGKPVQKGPRVRGIHWDTLNDVKGSVWEKRSATTVLRKLFPDLKSVFTEIEKKKAVKTEADDKPKEPAKPKEITFLEDKDSRNFGIALAKFKTNLPDFKERKFASLREALDRMDEVAAGGLDAIELLEKNVPTPEMIEKARGFDEEQAKLLAFGECYVWHMSKVKRFQARIECMKLKNTFGEMADLVTRDLGIFAAACSEVLDNPKLVVFLVDVIRPFGNELNRAGGKKDATGIKISGLVKLAATKTADNSMTSLYYIVSVLAQHQPDLLSLINEFGMCQRATKLSMQGTEQNLSACIKAAKKVEASLQIAEKEKDEVFCAAIGPFAAQVSAAVASMESRMASLKESILKVAEYLGEKEKTDKIDPIAKPETLFAAWHEFINLLLTTFNEYKKKMADLEKKRKEEEAKAKKAAEAEAKKAAAAAKGGAGADAKPKAARRPPTGLAAGSGPAAGNG